MEGLSRNEPLSTQKERTGLILAGLPMPPSENKSYPSAKNGRRFASEALKKFQQSMRDWRIINLELANRVKRKAEIWTMEGRVFQLEIVLGFHFSDLFTLKGEIKKMDASNRIKHIQDGIADAILGVDDKLFWAVRVSKVQIPDGMRQQCWAFIEPIEPKVLRGAEPQRNEDSKA